MKHSEALVAMLADLDTALSGDQRALLRELHEIAVRIESADGKFKIGNAIDAETGEPVVGVYWLGLQASLLPLEAREIGWLLVEAAAVSDAEAALGRFLQASLGVDARKLGAMLQEWRTFRRSEATASLIAEVKH